MLMTRPLVADVMLTIGNRLPPWLRAVEERLWLWRRNQRTRKALRHLADDQLGDIGMSPLARDRECEKWFWQV